MKAKKILSAVLCAVLALSMTACGETETVVKDDLSAVKERGTMKIGFTYYKPMNYKDENGELTGFETEFAKAVCEKLEVEPEFIEINWDDKLSILNSKDVDALWNGMTITPEFDDTITFSEPYLENYQLISIRKDDSPRIKGKEDLVGKKVEAEAGSAGEKAISLDRDLANAVFTPAETQLEALSHVKAGDAHAAVIDFVLADSMVGQGDFYDLCIIPDLQLSREEYAVGFRKDSSLADAVNEAVDELRNDGSLQKLAEKYELAEMLVSKQE